MASRLETDTFIWKNKICSISASSRVDFFKESVRGMFSLQWEQEKSLWYPAVDIKIRDWNFQKLFFLGHFPKLYAFSLVIIS